MVKSVPEENFVNNILQKVLKTIPLIATIPEVYLATTTTLIYNSYNDLEVTLSYSNNINLKIYTGKSVADVCAAVLVNY